MKDAYFNGYITRQCFIVDTTAKYEHIQFRVPDDIFVEFAETLSKAEFVLDISRAYISTIINPIKVYQ